MEVLGREAVLSGGGGLGKGTGTLKNCGESSMSGA